MGSIKVANRSLEGWRSDEEAPLSNGAELDRKQAFPSKSCELQNDLMLEDLQEFLMQVDSVADLTNNFDSSKRQLADERMVRASGGTEPSDTVPSQKRSSHLAPMRSTASSLFHAMVLSMQQQTTD